MRKIFFTVGKQFLLAAFAYSSTFSFAETTSIQTVRFEPCNYWRYDSTIGNYVCVWTMNKVEVPVAKEFNDLQRLVSDLQRKISDLESRVKVLEGRL